jgi:hypothetical protein
MFGCGLRHCFKVGRKPIKVTINVQIPFMPITSNGKEPDLEQFVGSISSVVERAAIKCQRANREVPKETILPVLRKGRRSEEDQEKYKAEMEEFASRLKEINSRVDFKMSSRGWCYVLENDHGLSKGEFDKAQDLINSCRKNGLLPIDFTAEDEARSADNLEQCDNVDPQGYALTLAQGLHQWKSYSPISFWDNQPVFIQMVVEKIDLKNLFTGICKQYQIPIINSRGWSDLNLRAGLMRRFQEHERKGRKPILLYCGDHDPVGLQIPDLLRKHFEDLTPAIGWSPNFLTIERFGLNHDFIEENNLTWIEGLKTSSGKDLGDSKHPQHNADFVQDYIEKFGRRKVEANALVVRPEAGRRLCREAIEKHLDIAAIATYEQALQAQRQLAKLALPEAVQHVLKDLEK